MAQIEVSSMRKRAILHLNEDWLPGVTTAKQKIDKTPRGFLVWNVRNGILRDLETVLVRFGLTPKINKASPWRDKCFRQYAEMCEGMADELVANDKAFDRIQSLVCLRGSEEETESGQKKQSRDTDKQKFRATRQSLYNVKKGAERKQQRSVLPLLVVFHCARLCSDYLNKRNEDMDDVDRLELMKREYRGHAAGSIVERGPSIKFMNNFPYSVEGFDRNLKARDIVTLTEISCIVFDLDSRITLSDAQIGDLKKSVKQVSRKMKVRNEDGEDVIGFTLDLSEVEEMDDDDIVGVKKSPAKKKLNRQARIDDTVGGMYFVDTMMTKYEGCLPDQLKDSWNGVYDNMQKGLIWETTWKMEKEKARKRKKKGGLLDPEDSESDDGNIKLYTPAIKSIRKRVEQKSPDPHRTRSDMIQFKEGMTHYTAEEVADIMDEVWDFVSFERVGDDEIEVVTADEQEEDDLKWAFSLVASSKPWTHTDKRISDIQHGWKLKAEMEVNTYTLQRKLLASEVRQDPGK